MIARKYQFRRGRPHEARLFVSPTRATFAATRARDREIERGELPGILKHLALSRIASTDEGSERLDVAISSEMTRPPRGCPGTDLSDPRGVPQFADPSGFWFVANHSFVTSSIFSTFYSTGPPSIGSRPSVAAGGKVGAERDGGKDGTGTSRCALAHLANGRKRLQLYWRRMGGGLTLACSRRAFQDERQDYANIIRHRR